MINITAQDSDTVAFQVVNKPDSALVYQSGNILRFEWPVTSSRKVGLLALLLAGIFTVLYATEYERGGLLSVSGVWIYHF